MFQFIPRLNGVTSVTLLLIASGSLFAEEFQNDLPDEPSVVDDQVIVISASRSEMLRQRSPTVVDVVEAEGLRLRGNPMRTQDQVSHIPGIYVDHTGGGFVGAGGIYIRGGRAHQTQYIIDGVPLNDPSDTQGLADQFLFVLPGLQRIEVAKGAQSGLYGSGASAGAISLQGLRPTKETRYGGRMEYGSFNTLSGEVQSTGMITEHFGFAVAANHLSTDGISSQTTTDVKGDPDGFEKDPFERKAFSGRFSWQNDDTEIFTSLLYFDSDRDFDARGKPDDTTSRIEQRSIRVHGGFRSDISHDLRLEGDLSYTTYDREVLGSSVSIYDSIEVYSSLRATYALNDLFDLTAGFDHTAESVDTNAFGTIIDERENIYGVWAELEANYENWTGQLVLRRDEHSREGDATTYRAGVSYSAFGGDWVIHASTGSGFRAPSLFELFHPLAIPIWIRKKT